MPQQELPQRTAERPRVEELVDEYRVALRDSLEDLTEEEARRQLVPSKTTLLGLVKHVTFVEGVWFDRAVTGRSYDEIGIAATVDGSFRLQVVRDLAQHAGHADMLRRQILASRSSGSSPASPRS